MSSDLKQVVGAVFVVVGEALGFTGWGLFFYAAGAALVVSGGRQAAKKAQVEARDRARAEAASRSIKANVRGSSETHFVVFGKVRAGGIICALGVDSTDASKLHIGLAHSITHPGGCDGVGALWVDDEKIETTDISGDGLTDDALITTSKYSDAAGSPSVNMIRFRHYRGTSTQAADLTLQQAGVAGGGSTTYRRGICWSRITLTKPLDSIDAAEAFDRAFPRGVPNFSFELSGCRCYDPRSDSTNGGSGSQRYTDATTWAFSQNPAVIAATYMIMEISDGGMGYDPATRIDWTSVASAANICDETVDDGQSPTITFTRYQCNVALNTADSRQENLQKILDTMQGVRVKVGAQFKIYAGAYRTPTFDLDETYLRGGVRISTRSSLEQLYNAVRVVHDDAEQNYRTVEAPAFTSAAYEAQDGGERLWKEMALPGVTNSHQAQYIAQVLGAQSRKQKIIELPCNLKALDIEAWETGTINLSELGLTGDVYRVFAWEWEGEGPKLTLREEASDVYDVSALSTPDATAATAPSVETPDAPSGVAAAGVIDGITIVWTGPDTKRIKQIDVYRSDSAESSSPTPTFTKIDSAVGYRYTDRVTNGATYYYKLKAKNGQGGESAFSAEVSATARTTPTAASVGGGVAVLDAANTSENSSTFLSVRPGFGMRVRRVEQ